MSMKSAAPALVESVAQALSWAITDPSGHPFSNDSACRNSGCGTTYRMRRRGMEETRQAATVFDSSAIPPITVDKYLLRLSATFRCSDTTFIAALIIVDRLLEYDGGRLPLTMSNVHRIFLASLVVAVKYHEDLVYSNKHYAKAGGVHLREVNRLERVLLASLDFNLRIEPEQYKLYEDTLQNMHASQDPWRSPRSPRSPEGAQQNAEVSEPPKVMAPAAVAAPEGAAKIALPELGETPARRDATGSIDAKTDLAGTGQAEPTIIRQGSVDCEGSGRSVQPCHAGPRRARTREPQGRAYNKDRSRCGQPFCVGLRAKTRSESAIGGDVTCAPWVQPPQRAILGHDVAVMVGAAVGPDPAGAILRKT
eukprot:gb/GFBE01034294.1/.p1 GENE.gb/GFBE01034294.1/~~gb/GFBE01034294.1/.p1  ORF type:complete len:366 (+),score=30.24 gb/GFBE01034294.1/:1-1098(+)